MRVIQSVLIALLTLSVPSVASAKKDNHPGKPHGQPQSQVHGGDQSGPAAGFRFTASERRAVNDYFGPQFRAGKCPPGLAKKGKGCVPPGLLDIPHATDYNFKYAQALKENGFSQDHDGREGCIPLPPVRNASAKPLN